MNDTSFEFGAVPNRYPDKVQRIAVLHRLQQQSSSAEEIRDSVQRLVGRWRARINELVTAGWSPRSTGDIKHNIMYARNCKPTFVMTEQRTRPCRSVLVCPFCYARWVRDVWQVIDGNFPPGRYPDAEIDEEGRELRAIELTPPATQETRRTEFRYKLVLRQHEFTRPVVPDENDMPASQHLASILKSIVENRKVIIDMVDPVGAFMYTTIEPTQDRMNWLIKHRQLFKLEQAHPIPEALVQATKGSIDPFCRPTRAIVLKAVAMACAYPVGLMQGDPDMVVDLLAARSAVKFKGSAKIRSFRGSDAD